MDIKSLDLHKFEDYGSRISRKISLNKTYGFGIPPTMYKEQDLARYDHVQLFYDPAQKVIGFHFVSNGSTGDGMKLNVYGETGEQGATLNARSFLLTHDIEPKKFAGKYEFKKENIEGIGEIYLIELKESKMDDTM